MTTLGTRASTPVVNVCGDSSELAAKAADLVIQSARDAIAGQGRFTFVLAGGDTPEKTYVLLAQPDRASVVDWAHVYIFFCDERFVPTEDERSNFGMARKSLLEHVPIPSANIFPMPTQGPNAAEAAAEYARQLAEFFSISDPTTPPRFDLILLGMGRDGHTASLFPRADALNVTDTWVTWSAPGILPPHVDRITLTYPVLNAARQIVFLVSGKEKSLALRDILGGHAPCKDRPAAGVQPVDGKVIWLVDSQAARLLKQRGVEAKVLCETHPEQTLAQNAEHDIRKKHENMEDPIMTMLKDQPHPQDSQARSAGNPLRELQKLGQSFWLDYISRRLISGGELQRLIAEDQLSGITSNPSIFEKAIAGGTDYDDFLARAAKCKEHDAMALYEGLAIRDIQDAADALRPTYERTERVDGYVSLEVSPYLAHDTKGTLSEAHRLWDKVERENLLIKVPATPEGLPAIRQLIAEGINVNITLLFSQKVYEQVAGTYIEALEKLGSGRGDVSRMASVASFFVSRIDTSVDALVEPAIEAASSEEEKNTLRSILGRTAVANAKLAYQMFKEIFSGPRWQALAAKGAHVQRLLWASTSTKNPKYRDVLYVEELIGRDTVNTMPPATIDAFREHGRPRASLEENLDEARAVMRNLAQAGISMDEITGKLTDDGVRLFADSFDRLLEAVENKRIHMQ